MTDFGFTNSTTIDSGLTYMGTWDALNNVPLLQSGVGVSGEYYIVSVAGSTNLDGISIWQIGDWAIFDGVTNQWQKISYSKSYSTIQDEGISLPQRTILDFQGNAVTASDNGSKTIVSVNVSSYGLFSQTSTSTPITNTIVETSLIDGGVGVLSVPPNGFSVGDAFKINMSGHLSSQNNRTIRIRIKANSVVLGDTGVLTLPAITNKHWDLDINFAIRATGIAGVASIASSGVFTYSKDASNAFEGVDYVTIENTLFDTTIANTLSITAEWGNASVQQIIYTDIFNLYKIY